MNSQRSFVSFSAWTRATCAVITAAAALVLAACVDLGELGHVRKTQDHPPQVIAEPPPAVQDPVETIARLEDARSDGNGLLELFLARGEERTRERAATALGRLPFPESGAHVTDALALALDDASPRVRAQAAFALGIRADPRSATALLAHWSDGDTNVRARIVEAASRVPDPKLRSEVLHALNDPEAQVRWEAAIAPHRWPTDADDAAVVDSALMDFLERPTVDTATSPSVRVRDDEIMWRLVFSLQQRKSERARQAFERELGARDARTRIFAAQGLAKIPSAESRRKALRAALVDADWRVVCEVVVALGKQSDERTLASFEPLAQHPSPHVRRAVFEALASLPELRDGARKWIESGRADASPNVRNAALAAEAKLFGDEVVPKLQELLQANRSNDVLASRAPSGELELEGVARAAACISPTAAEPMLLELSRDSDLRVAGIAVEGLGRLSTDAARARLRELLSSTDNGLRLASLEAMRGKHVPGDLALLRACYASAAGDGATEVAFNVLENAAAIGGDGARELIESATFHPDAFVRRKAHEWLQKSFAAEKREHASESNGRTDAETANDASRTSGDDPTQAASGTARARDDDPTHTTSDSSRTRTTDPIQTASESPPTRSTDLAQTASESSPTRGHDTKQTATESTRTRGDDATQSAKELSRPRGDGGSLRHDTSDTSHAHTAATSVPIEGRDYELGRRNPRVRVLTNRGSMTFELFPSEAPVHVYNFLELARRNEYDGLTFHRVVPDFVIQGGDYRGDGNGARTWRGTPLRAEFTPRKYVRGSLGMPRNEDPDSGGGQFFVTHRETPHLDGRYTIFGELREGFDVLDSIEVGDKILDVVIETDASGR